MNVEKMKPRERIWAALLFVAVVAGLCWPALVNRYPILAPDVLGYLADGPRVWLALVGRGDPWFSPGRSEAYSAGTALVGWGRSAWPTVILQAVLTAWVLWLIVRTLQFPRPLLVYAGMMAVLCGGTSLPWMVSWPMPDILGPLTYLCAALLVFAEERLSRGERWGLVALGSWTIASHLSHLIVAGCLFGLLAVLWLMRWRAVRGSGVGLFAVMIVSAMALQVGIHARVLGNPGLSGLRPPYLMARVIADGPGRAYLRAHCGSLDWVICRYQDRLTDESDQFLWATDGVWIAVSLQEQVALRREEIPLVQGALREYPRAQARASRKNFVRQLETYPIEEFPGRPWLGQRLSLVLPQYSAAYERTLQIHDALPTVPAERVAGWVVRFSFLVIMLLLWAMRRASWTLALAGVVGFVLVVNAAATAVLSEVSGRYQSRVIWMVVMVALLFAARLMDGRRARAS